MAVVVHSAAIQDRDGAKLVLARVLALWTRLQWLWADGGYAGELVSWVSRVCGWGLGIVKRNEKVPGWQLLPHRWIVERTFAWLGRYRRLSKDYEGRTDVSEGMIRVAMIHLMVRRLAPSRADAGRGRRQWKQPAQEERAAPPAAVGAPA